MKKTYILKPRIRITMPSRIVRFLRGDQRDTQNRCIKDMHDMPDWKIERTHDIIQWMFPTDIPSKHQPDAPVLTAEDIEAIKKDEHIKAIIQLSLTRMILYYEKDNYWITQKNHNFLRLTRILRCLWLVGFKHDYVCLQKALDEVFIDYPDIIGEETYLYWKNANNDEFMKNPKPETIGCYPPAPVRVTDDPELDELRAKLEFQGILPMVYGPRQQQQAIIDHHDDYYDNWRNDI